MNKTKVYLLLTFIALMVLGFIVLGVIWVGTHYLIIPASEYALSQNFASISHLALEQMPVQVQIRRIFGDDAKVALAIATAESHLNCKDVSSTMDFGIFQIHQTGGYGVDDLLDCTTNIKIAHEIFHKSGWTKWSVFKLGAYKKFLTN